MMKKKMYIYFMFLIFSLFSCNKLRVDKCNSIFAMDTIIDITFYNTENYEEHYKKIREIYYIYDQVANDFELSTKYDNIKKLNDYRMIDNASPELIELLTKAIELEEDTKGYFNPLIGRLSHLWKEVIKADEPYILDDEIIKSELEIMRQSKIIIEGNKIAIIGDANIDLGGIAKGFATNKAKEYLESENVSGYLINAGSSNVSLGDKGEAFNVGLAKPLEQGMIKKISTYNTSIGTSSYKYQHKIVDNLIIHHLLNPFTGYPANNYTNVNVICDDATLCDVYSTAIFTMELEYAIEFSKQKNIDILLYKDTILYESDGFK